MEIPVHPKCSKCEHCYTELSIMNEELKCPHCGLSYGKIDKTCPRDERMPCRKCSWWIRDGMRCKLGYIRTTEPPIEKPLGKDREYTTKW